MAAREQLTGGGKVLLVFVIILGGLTSVVSLITIASTGYTVVTGKALGADLGRSMVGAMGRDGDAAKAQYEETLARTVQVQKDLAPYTIAALVPYLVGTATAAVIALLLMIGSGGARVWLGRAALLACVARLAFGFVQHQITLASTEGVTRSFRTGVESAERQSGRRLDEATRERMRTMENAMGTMTKLATLFMAWSQTLGLCLFWALTGWWVLKKPKAAPPPSRGG